MRICLAAGCAPYKVPLHVVCLHFVEHLSCVVTRGVLDVVLVVFLRFVHGVAGRRGSSWERRDPAEGFFCFAVGSDWDKTSESVLQVADRRGTA